MAAWQTIRRIFVGIPKCLDWCVSVVECLIVLGVSVVVFHFGYHVWCGTLSPGERDTATLVSQNWKILVILMIPLFYQPVRIFLEEVQEVWGMRRPKKGAAESEEKAPDGGS